jgi:hypothetical protein
MFVEVPRGGLLGWYVLYSRWSHAHCKTRGPFGAPCRC